MVFKLTWLAGVLKDAGLKVAEVPGWESRGRAEMGNTVGVICHHTAGPAAGNMPSLTTLINGRTGLPGPLSQLGLGRDGTYYVIAAGRCNHAGEGQWQDRTAGNSSFIGIEGENTGKASDVWPDVQMDAYHRGVAAILKQIGQPAEFCAGHKEYALPPGRKPDPVFDMPAFRMKVATILDGTAPPPVLIPAVTPAVQAGGADRPTLRRGALGQFVRMLQLRLGAESDGFFGPKTEVAVREFQRDHGLVPDGIVGPKTWTVLDVA